MVDIAALFHQARTAWRDNGSPTIQIHKERKSYPAYVRASSLGYCPLKSAHEKLGTRPEIPAVYDERRTWRMDEGALVEDSILIPLAYYAMRQRDIVFDIQVDIVDHALKVSGRIDGILTVGGQPVILEVKDAYGQKHKSLGEPRLGHCYQALLYCMVTGIPDACIVTRNAWGRHFWRLVPVRPGAYVVQNERGQLYDGDYDGRWNNPHTLSFDTVKQEIERQHQVMAQVMDKLPVLPPISDPLNHSQGFLCMWHKVKPKKDQPGLVEASCAWATTCHGIGHGVYATHKIDKQYQLGHWMHNGGLDDVSETD